MDSKIVSAKLREIVRPTLKKEGFSRFTSRNAWRYHSDRIDVVNFQSFNSYMAGTLGCTTYSFAVNLGVLLRCIPSRFGDESDGWETKQLRPSEYDCNFRGGLRRSFPQPELERRDIWYIDPCGKYLDKAAENTRLLLSGEGMLWFERFENKAEVLRILMHEPEVMQHLWGFGLNPSPIRSYMIGYVALEMGNSDLSRQHLLLALESGCFSGVEARLKNDIADE